MVSDSVKLSVDNFGTIQDLCSQKQEKVSRFTWTNGNKMTVQVISYGAMITSVKVPNKTGDIQDVALGYDNIEGYLKDGNPAYFGSLMGRVANRVGNGEFDLNGKKYKLAKNFLGKHSLHGGLIGFDKCNWDHHVEGTTVYLTHTSPDGFEGYPGTVITTVACRLSDDNAFSMSIKAVTSKSTIINLSNHSYFNLAGHDKGCAELYKHIFTINADKTVDIDTEQIPTGKLLNVGGTPFDFRVPRQLGIQMSKIPGTGIDNNFCLTQASQQSLTFCARVVHPDSGRFMEVYTDQPSVLFYTSNNLPDPCGKIKPTMSEADYNCPPNPEKQVIGKGGVEYRKHGAFCLETQKHADAIHHENFPSIILNPGQIYEHVMVYKFGVTDIAETVM